MKPPIFSLYLVSGLVAGLATPEAKTWQATIMNYYNTEVRPCPEAASSILTIADKR